jgi:hypothetical protein
MKFTRIDNAFEVCEKHLDATSSHASEVASFLVGYLTVIIIAEYEMKLEAILNKRAERPGDVHIQSFMKVAIDRLTRSVDVGEITGLLKHFGGTCKDDFKDAMAKAPKAVTYYGNIVERRHDVAHSTGAHMTFSDLEVAYKESMCVFQAVADAIGLTADEAKDF